MFMIRNVALTVTDTMTHFRPTTQTGKTCHALLGLLASLVFCPVPAVAQEADFTLQGFIFDSSSATPIGDVVLELDGIALEARSGPDGAFVITDVPPGGHTLMAFKDAFVSKAFEFSIPPNSPSTIDMGVLALARVVVREVTVFGTVSDATNNRPIESVRIAINDTVIAITELDGGFAVQRRIAQGFNRLTVQRFGYETLFRDIEIEPTSTEISLMVTLERQVTRLRNIVVETEEPALNKKLEGFYERRAQGVGQFLGPEEIARIPASRASDILRRMPALSVRPLPGQTEIMINRCLRHLARVYVDGLEVFDADIDLMLNALDIAAVEVYTGGAQIPLQFNRPAPRKCGVVIIWTKIGRP